MVKSYLSDQGYTVASGIWNSRAVMDNSFLATTNLWTFQDHTLMPKVLVEEAA